MSRPLHYDEYGDMHEIVPGVFMDGADVYIVDDLGEVCCWVESEYEDPSAVQAALCAVALATKKGAIAVRRNIVTKGKTLDALIYETIEEVEKL